MNWSVVLDSAAQVRWSGFFLEVILQLLDYSAGVPRASEIKKAGYAGAIRYISPARASWMKGKPTTKAEVKALKKEDLRVFFVWQYGKESDADVMRGRQGGILDARNAQKKLDELGESKAPVFFAVDFDITLEQWNQYAAAYFRAVGSVLGRDRVGIYGHSRVLAWAVEDQVIGAAYGRFLAWQTEAWSRGVRAPEAIFFQQAKTRVHVDGVECDVNDVLVDLGVDMSGKIEAKRAPIGRAPGRRGDPVWLPDVLRAFGCTVHELPGWKDTGHGDFNQVRAVGVHHIGANRYHPSNIQNHPELGLCSQLHLARSGEYTVCGAGVAWHMGRGSFKNWPTNNANVDTIGIEAESDGVSPWPEVELEAYYRGCAAILWYLGLPATTEHLLGHWEYSQRAQGKWDPGAGNGTPGATMDMEDFRRKVQYYIDNPPFEEVEMDFDRIDRKYRSLVEGSTWEGRPMDVLLTADAHSFNGLQKGIENGRKLDELGKIVVEQGKQITRLTNALEKLINVISKEK